MNLIETTYSGDDFRLVFSEEKEDQEIRRIVEITLGWNRFRSADYFEIVGNAIKFPFDTKQALYSIPIHIPHEEMRQMFKKCFIYIVKTRSLPVDIAEASHPGYPLTVVTYNGDILEKNEMLEIIEFVRDGVAHAQIEYISINEEESLEEDEEFSEHEVIIEYEEDDDLKEVMKPVNKTRFLPWEDE